MIRYVIAIVLASAMMAVTMPAIDDTAAFNSEKQVEQELAAIEEAAISLLYNEELSATESLTPTRQVTVSFPRDSLTSDSISMVRFEPEPNVTVATFHVEGRAVGQYVIDAPLVDSSMELREFSLEGDTDLDLQLSLKENENGRRVVVVERRHNTRSVNRIEVTNISTNSPINSGEELTITATLKNPNSQDAHRLPIEFKLGTMDTRFETVTVRPGTVVELTVTYSETGPHAGTHTIEVWGDTVERTSVEIR